MAKRLLDGAVKAGLVGWLLTSGVPAEPTKSVEAWQRLSRLQCLLEYFFMETGVYPLDLAEMDQVFRARAPRAPRPIPIPVDPATNQPFKYQVQGRKYTIAVPDPSKYGGEKIALTTIDWGFLSDLADLKRFEQIIRSMSALMKVTATQCEMYAKDHSGQYPASLDDLLPKYITRFPNDPLTGKNLAYKKLVDGYIISCPNPEKYGMKIFQYSSAQGIVMEQVRREAPKPEGNGAKPEVAPKTEPAPESPATPAPAPK